MSDKISLVLHLTSGGSPLLFPINPDDRAELERNVPLWLDHGSVHTVTTADGQTVSVNFGHVAVAYVEDRSRTPFGLR